MFSRRPVILLVFVWIGLLSCLFTFTMSWPLSPLYGRRRLLRNEQDRHRTNPEIVRFLPEGRPTFGHRISRSVGNVEVDYANMEQKQQSDAWERELQDTIVRKGKRQDQYKTLVFFDCFPGEAICSNGGQGPAITYRWQGIPICTCLCPVNFTSARCESSAAGGGSHDKSLGYRIYHTDQRQSAKEINDDDALFSS